MELFLLYVGDQYLTTESLRLVGVFTTEENMNKCAETLINSNSAKSFVADGVYNSAEELAKACLNEFKQYKQTFSGSVRLLSDTIQADEYNNL